MATKYSGFVVDSPSEIERWINSTGENSLFALIDFQVLSSKQKETIASAYGDSLTNLYDDLSGTALAELGPRLVTVAPENRAATLEFLVNGYPISLLIGACGISVLDAHLRNIREVVVPEDTYALFRFQDGKVTKGLFPAISEEQGERVLGPLVGWCVLDACRTCHTLVSVDGKKNRGQLRFDKRLVSALDDQLFIHSVAAQVRETDTALLSGLSACQIEKQIERQVQKGSSLGLDQPSDLSLYCILSFQFPEGFERISPFPEALRYRENGDESFGVALGRVSSDVWEAWDERLATEKTK